MKLLVKQTMFFALTGLLSGIFTSCGKNNSEPAKETIPVEERDFTSDGLQLSETNLYQQTSGGFILAAKWINGPKMGGGDDVLESRFKFLIYSKENGQSILGSDISDVNVSIWMPEHGHDTGNEKPAPKVFSSGVVGVTNIYLFMLGKWEVITKLKISGVDHEFKYDIEVTE